MICLIIITFIAELIITVFLVSKLYSLDRKVVLISDEIEINQNELTEIMSEFKQVTVNVNEFILLLKDRIIKYKNDFVLAQLKSVLQTVLLVTFKPKYRKLFLSLKFGSKFVKRLSKRLYMLQ